MNAHDQNGFTLWELLMAVLVGGILLGIGVPNVMEFQRNSAMTAAANDLVTATLQARTEAVKRQAPVTLCLTDNPTDDIPTCEPAAVSNSGSRGYVVFVDENENFDADGARILTDGSDGDGVVDAGELVLSRIVPPGGTIQISANCGYVSFGPSGFTRQAGALVCPQNRTVLFCDDRGRRVAAGALSSARIVRTARPGRAQVLAETQQVNPALIGLNAALIALAVPAVNCP